MNPSGGPQDRAKRIADIADRKLKSWQTEVPDAVGVAHTVRTQPPIVDVFLGAAIAASVRTPVVCYADQALINELGLRVVTDTEVAECVREHNIALLALQPQEDPDQELAALLTFPPGVDRYVAGVYDADAAKLAVEAAKLRGAKIALAVNSFSGNEIFDTEGKTHLYQLERDVLKRRRIRPADCGVPDNEFALLAGSGVKVNAHTIRDFAEGRGSGHNLPPSRERAVHHAVIINAALILLAAGNAISLQDGAEQVKADVVSGDVDTAMQGLTKGKSKTHNRRNPLV